MRNLHPGMSDHTEPLQARYLEPEVGQEHGRIKQPRRELQGLGLVFRLSVFVGVALVMAKEIRRGLVGLLERRVQFRRDNQQWPPRRRVPVEPRQNSGEAIEGWLGNREHTRRKQHGLFYSIPKQTSCGDPLCCPLRRRVSANFRAIFATQSVLRTNPQVSQSYWV